MLYHMVLDYLRNPPPTALRDNASGKKWRARASAQQFSDRKQEWRAKIRANPKVGPNNPEF